MDIVARKQNIRGSLLCCSIVGIFVIPYVFLLLAYVSELKFAKTKYDNTNCEVDNVTVALSRQCTFTGGCQNEYTLNCSYKVLDGKYTNLMETIKVAKTYDLASLNNSKNKACVQNSIYKCFVNTKFKHIIFQKKYKDLRPFHFAISIYTIFYAVCVWILLCKLPSLFDDIYYVCKENVRVYNQQTVGNNYSIQNDQNIESNITNSVNEIDIESKPTVEMQQLVHDDAINVVDNVPIYFKCPITLHIMTDPIICNDGHTYEKTAIDKINVSPITRQTITFRIENRNLKNAIDVWNLEN